MGRITLERSLSGPGRPDWVRHAFVLAEGIDVRGAWLDSGLLHIDLARPQPETRVRTIEITQPNAQANTQLGPIVASRRVGGN